MLLRMRTTDTMRTIGCDLHLVGQPSETLQTGTVSRVAFIVRVDRSAPGSDNNIGTVVHVVGQGLLRLLGVRGLEVDGGTGIACRISNAWKSSASWWPALPTWAHR